MRFRNLLIGGIVSAVLGSIALAQVPGVNSPWNMVFAIPVDNHRASYNAGASFVPPASATDVFTVCGSATKTLYITRLSIAGRGSAVQPFDVSVVLRSTADAGGTSVTVTPVAYGTEYSAATGAAKNWTGNPTTLGTLIGTLITDQINISNLTTGVGSVPLVLTFGNRPASALILNGAAQCLGVNLRGATVTTPVFDINAEWTEQ